MTLVMSPARHCLLCGKPLQVVGLQRKNGAKHHSDWDGRKFHKQCWAKLHARSHSRPSFSGKRGGRRGKGRSGSNYV